VLIEYRERGWSASAERESVTDDKEQMSTSSRDEEDALARRRAAVRDYAQARRRIILDATALSFIGSAIGAAAASAAAAALALPSPLAGVGLGVLRAPPAAWAGLAGAVAGGGAAAAFFARERGLADALDADYLRAAAGLSEAQVAALRRVV
jgi:hypothetical protein